MKKRHLLIGGLIVFAIGRSLGPGETQDAVAPTPTAVEAVSIPSSSLTPPAALQSEPQAKKSEPAKMASLPKNISQPISSPPAQSPDLVARFVQGSSVAFRDAPSSQGRIIDRFDKGRAVGLIETGGGWSRVRDELTQQEGWIATRFLTDTVKRPKETESSPKQPVRNIPIIPDTAIIQRIIAFSIENYSGSCACPYNTDRRGRKCGSRSAYSKPGGYAPVCYPQDVTAAMIEAFRRQ